MPREKSKKRSDQPKPKVDPGITSAALLASSGVRTWDQVQYRYASCVVRRPVTAMRYWHQIKEKGRHFANVKAKREAWNLLTKEEKDPFTQMAAKDYSRYEEDMAEWYRAWLDCTMRNP